MILQLKDQNNLKAQIKIQGLLETESSLVLIKGAPGIRLGECEGHGRSCA